MAVQAEEAKSSYPSVQRSTDVWPRLFEKGIALIWKHELDRAEDLQSLLTVFPELHSNVIKEEPHQEDERVYPRTIITRSMPLPGHLRQSLDLCIRFAKDTLDLVHGHIAHPVNYLYVVNGRMNSVSELFDRCEEALSVKPIQMNSIRASEYLWLHILAYNRKLRSMFFGWSVHLADRTTREQYRNSVREAFFSYYSTKIGLSENDIQKQLALIDGLTPGALGVYTYILEKVTAGEVHISRKSHQFKHAITIARENKNRSIPPVTDFEADE